jgi:hypothetical protein
MALQLPKSIQNAIAKKRPAIPQDRVDDLRGLVELKLELDDRKAELEKELSKINAKLLELTRQEIPEVMDGIGSKITLNAEGNHPEINVKVAPFYSANIQAGWDDERKAAAFKWLEENGHGELIKTEVGVAFPREDRKKAVEFLKAVEKMGLNPSLKASVHFMTLTAWLREQVEDHNRIPPLEVIGGFIGREASVKRSKS